MHTSIVCSQSLIEIFYLIFIAAALNNSHNTWHLTLQYTSLYNNTAGLSTPLLYWANSVTKIIDVSNILCTEDPV